MFSQILETSQWVLQPQKKPNTRPTLGLNILQGIKYGLICLWHLLLFKSSMFCLFVLNCNSMHAVSENHVPKMKEKFEQRCHRHLEKSIGGHERNQFLELIHCFVCFMLVSVFPIVIVEKSMWFIVVSM
jgi:hypothetical protein